MDCYCYEAKTKALISYCAADLQKNQFSHDAAHFSCVIRKSDFLHIYETSDLCL